MKIKIKIGNKFNIINDFNDTYYIVSNLPKLHIIHHMLILFSSVIVISIH